MKKYIIKNADGSEQNVMPAVHTTRTEAGITLMNYIDDHNEDLDADDDRCLSPFDFALEEVECGVNEVITNFESAKRIVGSSRFILAKKSSRFSCVELNIGHTETLIALNKLFTLAEAWNKEDGFIPDFSDEKQDKWFPWFRYDQDSERFVCMDTHYAPTRTHAGIGSRLCFKTSERAKQFGEQFIDLYNKVFL